MSVLSIFLIPLELEPQNLRALYFSMKKRVLRFFKGSVNIWLRIATSMAVGVGVHGGSRLLVVEEDWRWREAGRAGRE